MRLIGTAGFLLGGLAAAGEVMRVAFPTARWFFETSRQVPWLHVNLEAGKVFPWFGWLSAALLIVCGMGMLVRSFTRGPRNPITVRRIKRFREIKRGYYSLVILITLGGLAALDQMVVGKQALAVQPPGRLVLPAFQPAARPPVRRGAATRTAQLPLFSSNRSQAWGCRSWHLR